MRIVDIMSAFPTLLFAILLLTVLGSGLGNIFLVISLTSWIGVARLFRGQILSLREQDYVLAARSIGATDWHIMLRHLVPNSLVPIIVGITLGIPAAIFAEAGLSFLGLGDPTIPTWGQILEYGFRTGAVFLGYWWWVVPPGLLIVLTAVTFMFLALGLEPVVDPRLRGRRSWHF